LQYRRSKGLPVPNVLPRITTVKNDYHQKFHGEAIMTSLYSYFVGGVLFGLAADAQRFDSKVTYKKLQIALAKELTKQGAKYGLKFSPADLQFETLSRAVKRARQKSSGLSMRCSTIFEGN
jgi:hypothetical protein